MQYRFNSADLADFLSTQYVVAAPEGAVTTKRYDHAQLGSVAMSGQSLPGMSIQQLSWEIPENDLLLEDPTPPATQINIAFQLKGNLITRFAGINHPLNMTVGVHNLVYLSKTGDQHEFASNQSVCSFMLNVEKDHFRNLLDERETWAKKMIKQIDKDQPFAASERSPEITPKMCRLLQLLSEDVHHRPLKQLRTQSIALELLNLQLKQFSQESSNKPTRFSKADLERLAAVKTYLDHHFLEEMSLSHIAKIGLLNEFKLKAGFKELYGDTVFGYVRALRMNHGACLLRDTQHSIEEIGNILGYIHSHHFAKAFEAHSGLLPSLYRRK